MKTSVLVLSKHRSSGICTHTPTVLSLMYVVCVIHTSRSTFAAVHSQLSPQASTFVGLYMYVMSCAWFGSVLLSLHIIRALNTPAVSAHPEGQAAHKHSVMQYRSLHPRGNETSSKSTRCLAGHDTSYRSSRVGLDGNLSTLCSNVEFAGSTRSR
jgi:hypothetical protein